MDDYLEFARYALSDALTVAKLRADRQGHIVSGEPVMGVRECQLDAIAAALIALAEKPQFVQVGRHTIKLPITYIQQFDSPDEAARVGVDFPTIFVYYSANSYVRLTGEDRTAFLAWWNEHANVVRLDVEETK